MRMKHLGMASLALLCNRFPVRSHKTRVPKQPLAINTAVGAR